MMFVPFFQVADWVLVRPYRVLLIGILVWSVTSLSIKGPGASCPTTILLTGVSSLVSSTDGLVVVGTKTGRFFVSQKPGDVRQGSKWQELDREHYSPNYPIYSLALGKDSMFSGGGDRYVSVWTQQGSGFHFQGTLGPHTGWVKDLAYCPNSKLLYSIGCNCIECWDVSDLSATAHLSKRSIENSPDMGSTLSSDLLSLCLVADQCLLSGGVDGRIHIWSLNPLDMEPLQSSRVHDGRVNAMVYASQIKVLFSVGHDGSIIASKLWKGPRGLETISKLLVGEQPVRLSTLCLVNESTTSCRLVVGTTEGQVINIDVRMDHDGINLVEESRLSIDGEPMVYCLGIVCSSKDASEQSTILVGQAYGLIAIQT